MSKEYNSKPSIKFTGRRQRVKTINNPKFSDSNPFVTCALLIKYEKGEEEIVEIQVLQSQVDYSHLGQTGLKRDFENFDKLTPQLVDSQYLNFYFCSDF